MKTWLEGCEHGPAVHQKRTDQELYHGRGTPEVVNGSSFDDSGHLPPISPVVDRSASAGPLDSKGQENLTSLGLDDSDTYQNFADNMP